MESSVLLIVIAAIVTILLVGALAYVFIFSSRRAKAYVEEIDEVKENQSKKITKARIEAKETERKRIGGDLHDDIGPMLSVLKMNIQNFKTCKSEAETDAQITKVNGMLDEVTAHIRAMSKELVPEVLVQLGLKTAIEQICYRINTTGQMYVEFDAPDTFPDVSQNFKTNILRMVQELTNNALKYSKGDHIQVKIEIVEGDVIIKVEDNGVGIDLEHLEKKDGGFGLKNLAVRARELKGTFSILPIEPNGTEATIILPT